jgi:hypothetical protein
VFALGFFVSNSEVGRRSIGVTTFWLQSVCSNHVVWDATEITEYTRRHTGMVDTAFGEIRRIIETLVAKRDARKDAFATVIANAMNTRCGLDAQEVQKQLVDGVHENAGDPRSFHRRGEGAFLPLGSCGRAHAGEP